MVEMNAESKQPPDPVDVSFETFYRAFISMLSISGDNVAEVLLDFPERYRDRIFKRWQDEGIPPVIGAPPAIRRAKPLWREGYSSAVGPRWFALKSFLEQEKKLEAGRVAALDSSSDSVLFSVFFLQFVGFLFVFSLSGFRLGFSRFFLQLVSLIGNFIPCHISFVKFSL
jgi:hypothetical protein